MMAARFIDSRALTPAASCITDSCSFDHRLAARPIERHQAAWSLTALFDRRSYL